MNTQLMSGEVLAKLEREGLIEQVTSDEGEIRWQIAPFGHVVHELGLDSPAGWCCEAVLNGRSGED